MNEPQDNPEMDAALEREIAEGEAWLGSYPDEEPTPLAIARTKQAMHAELAASQSKPKRHWAAWIGVAAAAAIVFAVITSRPGATPTDTTLAEAGPDTEIVSPWSSDDTTELNEMSEAVTELETWATNTAGDWDVASVYTAVEIAPDEMSDDDTDLEDISLRPHDRDSWGEIVRYYDA